MSAETKVVDSLACELSSSMAGKHLLFHLARQTYALPVAQVREIICPPFITRVPRTSRSILGVINIRGKVISVMDLRTRFGLDDCATDEQRVVIVLEYELEGRCMTLGIVVDEVLEVTQVHAEDIAPRPQDSSREGYFIAALSTPKKGDTIFLLDVDAVVNIDMHEIRRVTPKTA